MRKVPTSGRDVFGRLKGMYLLELLAHITIFSSISSAQLSSAQLSSAQLSSINQDKSIKINGLNEQNVRPKPNSKPDNVVIWLLVFCY